MGEAAHPRVSPYLRKANAQREAEGLETSVKVWELKKAGLSFRQIADQLEMSPSGVHDAYKRVLTQLRKELAETVEDWTQLMLSRLEEIAAFQFRVVRGMDVRPKELRERDPVTPEGERVPSPTVFPTVEERLGAARDVVRTSESLRKMLGLDAPEKTELSGRFMVGTVDLTELAGGELAKEVEALGAGLRTRTRDEVKQLMQSNENGNEAPSDAEAQPQEV